MVKTKVTQQKVTFVFWNIKLCITANQLLLSRHVEHGHVAAQIALPCEAAGFARLRENPALICYLA